MATDAEVREPDDERVWLQRAVFVLQSPRAVFEALRDDRDEPARAREEAVLALILLAGIAGVLWTPIAGRLRDDPAFKDALNVAVWAFIGGAIYGIALYWASGALLFAGTRAAGGKGSYRQARQLLAFAAAPVALSLFLVVPVRLSVYGGDVFGRGGADHGPGNTVFVALELALVAWAVTLLVLGVRTINGWSWSRALVACALAAGLPALVVLATAFF
ncbi:MAG: YIP1 family protein [Actinomycetota bacterium]|nr:YIP1 family protein [Actinomycetota bacterium]